MAPWSKKPANSLSATRASTPSSLPSEVLRNDHPDTSVHSAFRDAPQDVPLDKQTNSSTPHVGENLPVHNSAVHVPLNIQGDAAQASVPHAQPTDEESARSNGGSLSVTRTSGRSTDQEVDETSKIPKDTDSSSVHPSQAQKRSVVSRMFGHKVEKMAEKIVSSVKRGNIFRVRTEDLNPDDIIIAVMGPTGTGKSSFINMATGNVDGVGHELESCTTEINILKLHCVERTYRDIIFVDTPGFDDTHKSDIEILDMIADWLKKTYARNVKLAGILYFHRISDNRMAGTPLKNLHMFERLCGKNALENIILTTTMWDEVTNEMGGQRESELTKHYWKSMIDQGSHTMRYRNSEESAWEIVDSIAQSHNEKYAMELQRELVDLGQELPETGAGRELYGKLQSLVARQQEILQGLRVAMKLRHDQATVESLRDEYESLRKQLEATMHDMEVLKIPIGKRLTRFFTLKLGFFGLRRKGTAQVY